MPVLQEYLKRTIMKRTAIFLLAKIQNMALKIRKMKSIMMKPVQIFPFRTQTKMILIMMLSVHLTQVLPLPLPLALQILLMEMMMPVLQEYLKRTIMKRTAIFLLAKI